jgi:hypothetical protein
MDTIALADRIVKATCHLVVVNEQKKVVSAGSGVLVEGGKLLTAGHVLFRRVGHAYPGSLMIRGHAGVIPLTLGNFVAFPEINVGLPELVRPVRLDIILANCSETPAGMSRLTRLPRVSRPGTLGTTRGRGRPRTLMRELAARPWAQ